MSRFNSVRTTEVVNNLAGGQGFNYNKPEFVLYTLCAASFITNTHYRSPVETINEIRKAVANCSPEYVAKLAVYCRETLNLRTAPLVLLVELAKITQGNSVVSRGITRSIKRADEITEILGYYMAANHHSNLKKLSKQVSKGVRDAFYNFDAYQFAKYKSSGKDISLRDAMFVTHPKPRNTEERTLFSAIANDTLEVANTWESAKSALGQKMVNASEEDKKTASKEVWEAQINSRKLGYMAMLRNLRNILQDNVSIEAVQKVCEFLENPVAIANSRQLPFRFYTAYREINSLGDNNDFGDFKKIQMIVKSIKSAGIQALGNMDMFEKNDRIIAISDVSGSMCAPLSSKGSVSRAEVALFYTSMFGYLNNSRIGYFGEKFGIEKNVDIDPFMNALRLEELSRKYGHSTNAHKVFDSLHKSNTVVDKMIIFTDEQFWDKMRYWGVAGIKTGNIFNDKLAGYRKDVNPDLKLYMIDLAGYGVGSPMKFDGNTIKIAGFSDDTFKMLGNMNHSYDVVKEISEMIL